MGVVILPSFLRCKNIANNRFKADCALTPIRQKYYKRSIAPENKGM